MSAQERGLEITSVGDSVLAIEDLPRCAKAGQFHYRSDSSYRTTIKSWLVENFGHDRYEARVSTGYGPVLVDGEAIILTPVNGSGE